MFISEMRKVTQSIQIFERKSLILIFISVIRRINSITVFNISLDKTVTAKKVPTLTVSRSFKTIIKTQLSFNENYLVTLLYLNTMVIYPISSHFHLMNLII
jgi:hypothetical protein